MGISEALFMDLAGVLMRNSLEKTSKSAGEIEESILMLFSFEFVCKFKFYYVLKPNYQPDEDPFPL